MFIPANDGRLRYSGRIDFDDPSAPVLVYAATYIKINFTGTSVKAELKNHRNCWSNYMGYVLDGEKGKFLLPNDEKATYTIAEGLPDARHELMLYKRMDSCHYVTFYGFELDDGAEVLPPPEMPRRRMEFFGDSVTCGEVSEAVDYVGKEDPVHDGEYSDSWCAYSWKTARKLDAEVHLTSQGGISLLDGTGYFADPYFLGMESSYDKIEYNPGLGETKPWDFSLYTPHVVVVAIGQNDSYPYDCMAEDYDGSQAVKWREHYKAFIEKLMEIYPRAHIILATTILGHNPNWDKAIGEVCHAIGSPRVTQFLYSKNGCGTPGHIREPEAEVMADELSGYIRSLGEEIWQD
ncbi:MAG: GDSL-type esterase/lipase family protein [Clostridiales bacterium]|nr:GDSL-type esterase/lipase family protein [Clostridiales bacterium]